MDKELQDLSWKSLPKQTRNKIRSHYNEACDKQDSDYCHLQNKLFIEFIENIFGEHNLSTSMEMTDNDMKPEFERICVHVKSKEEDEELREILHHNGYSYLSGTSLLEHSYYNTSIRYIVCYTLFADKKVGAGWDNVDKLLTLPQFKEKCFLISENK